MKSLDDYREIVGDDTIAEIYKRARRLQGRRVIHINSTNHGGGVAEMLSSLVPLMNDVGIEEDWRVLPGTSDFFAVANKLHNGLQGGALNLTDAKKKLYVHANEAFSAYCNMDADCVIIHDPPPLPMVKFHRKTAPWIWRCHADLSSPNEALWEFLKTFLLRYDVGVFSSDAYTKEELPIEQRVIHPAIDPLSHKNRELSKKEVARFMQKAGISVDKPIVTQVSRMDEWKDPEGLLEVFKRVRERVDCRLIYCYDLGPDDPGSDGVYERTYRKAARLVREGDVVFLPGNSQIIVNAIQRASTVVVQKSLKEGFSLCVTEALWKGKPVVAANVGGIPHQLKDGENGFLADPHDNGAFADKIVEILRNPSMAEQMGMKGKEAVRSDFLITRLILDHLDLLNDLLWRRVRTAR